MATRLASVKEQEEMVTQTDEGMESIIEYSINLQDQERPPILPIGEYAAEVVGFEKKISQTSGRPYFNVKVSVSADNQPADFVEALGTQGPINMFAIVMGAADNQQDRFTMRLFCEALRVPLSDKFLPTDFLNKECRVQVRHGKHLDGSPKPEVARIIRA